MAHDAPPPSGLARVRDPGRGPAGDALPPPRTHDRQRTVLATAWTLLALAAAVGLAAVRVRAEADLALQGVPVAPTLSAALTTLLATGLAWRTGGRPLVAAVVGGLLTATAVVTGYDPLLAGAALGAAVVGAALAVLLTVPARSLPAVVREVVLALVVAGVAALATWGYGAPVDDTRLSYVALGLALLLTLVVVHRPAGGVHALGRAGVLLVLGGVLLLALSLAYAWALQRWGAPSLVADVTAARDRARDLLGAVPAPLQVLVGVPALVVGVAVRDRRRQGWWVCAFGTTATTPVTVGLVTGDDATTLLLATAYAAALGLLLGLLVLGLLRLLGRAGSRGHRPEPSRIRALR
ncbi:hypothetical protein [Nocardioides aequoreus]|uniref:hypothetical protein n=1 Tax=Nocardioides aequoreus TaxID=397278 RepID=UPI00068998E4|nr:hypothetical protein [Nocardioides aequoreus]